MYQQADCLLRCPLNDCRDQKQTLYNEMNLKASQLISLSECVSVKLGKAGGSDAKVRTTKVVKAPEKCCDVEILGRFFISSLMKISL